MSPVKPHERRWPVRALRVDALHRLLLSDRGRSALTVEDIASLPDLVGWDSYVLRSTISDLVASGVLTDDAFGRLHVQPVDGAAA